MSNKKQRFSYLKNIDQNVSKQQVLRTQLSRSYLNENIFEKVGSSQRYRTGYHFKLKQALKENPRNMFYLRRIIYSKNPQANNQESQQAIDSDQTAQPRLTAQHGSESTPNHSQALIE